MKMKKILKADIKELLKRAVNEWETYIPLENEGGDALFTFLPKDAGELEEALGRVNLKDEWVVISPKDVFFPQMETLFHFDENKIEQEVEASKKLVFGVRPCDTKAIHFVDEFFKRNFEDIYYLSRAKDRLMVTIGCNTPPRPDACFCTSAKTGPFLEDGFDLQMVDTGEAYLVEVGSKKGKDFADSYPELFKDVEDEGETSEKLKKVRSEAAKSVGVNIEFEEALEIMKGKGDQAPEENYKRIGERCIMCGGCVYVCPTCTCFNVFDEKKEDNGVRRRNWDTCVFAGYTREASGHNPRDEKWLRAARRYEHKLKHDYNVTGMSGCVACGRCLASCPVDIGMSKFIEEITTNKRII